MSLYNTLLGSGSYIAINKTLIKNLGLESGFLFSTLIDFENYLITKENIQSGEWFFVTRQDLEKQTTLSDYKQKEAEKKLIEIGLIEIKLKGVPAKNHYRICSDLVLKIFENWSLNNLGSSNENSSEHIYNNTNIKPTKKEIIENFYNDFENVKNETQKFYPKLENQQFNSEQTKIILENLKSQMLDYYIGGKGKKKEIKDMLATFKNWLLKIPQSKFYMYSKINESEQSYQAQSQVTQQAKQEEAQNYTRRTEAFEESDEDKRKHELEMQIQNAGVEKIKNELEAGTFDFSQVSSFARITIKNIPDITNKAQAIYGNLLSQGKI